MVSCSCARRALHDTPLEGVALEKGPRRSEKGKREKEPEMLPEMLPGVWLRRPFRRRAAATGPRTLDPPPRMRGPWSPVDSTCQWHVVEPPLRRLHRAWPAWSAGGGGVR